MKEVVFIKGKSITLVFSQNQTFLHGKDSTFLSSNPRITKRINQIIGKKAWHFSNLVSSLRLNTFMKIYLYQWINRPFTPPHECELET